MKPKNYIISLFMVTIGCVMAHSQEFKERHVKKLKNLGIQYKVEYSASEKATKDLHKILHYDFRRKAKNTFGTITLTVGLGSLVGGLLLMQSNQYDPHGFRSIAASGFLVVGAAGVGTSIPIFIGAGKSRKRRDQLKLLYQTENVSHVSLLQTEFLKASENSTQTQEVKLVEN